MEAKKRWHVPPAFSVEFVSYYHDRAARIEELRRRLGERLKEDGHLRDREARTRPNFDLASRRCESARETNEEKRKEVTLFRETVDKLRPGESIFFSWGGGEGRGEVSWF